MCKQLPSAPSALRELNRIAFWQGIRAALPIVIGYIPLAISYGVLAVQTGISIGHTLAMSLFIYAGASQFMAVNMLSLGATAAELIMATFVINFRHFVLSFSLMSRLKQVPRPWKAFLSFGITDETFAVSMMKGEEAGQTGALDRGNPPSRPGEELTPASYLLGLFLAAYLAWISGTLAGALLAMVIPPSVGANMVIALYAMFIGLLVPAVRRFRPAGLIALASGLLSALFTLVLNLNSGWAIIWATLLASALGLIIFKGDED